LSTTPSAKRTRFSPFRPRCRFSVHPKNPRKLRQKRVPRRKKEEQQATGVSSNIHT
jgi:hypothetical protein